MALKEKTTETLTANVSAEGTDITADTLLAEDLEQTTLSPEEEEQKREDDLKTLMEHPLIKGELDRRVSGAVKTTESRMRLEIREKAREKAEKKAREEELLKEGKLEELVETKTKEAEKATAELEAYVRKDNINRLLDLKEVTGVHMRELFHGFGGDLEELSNVIDKYKEQYQSSIDAAVEKEINKSLETEPPPKSSGPVIDESDIDAQIAAAIKKGDYKTSFALKSKKSEQAFGG